MNESKEKHVIVCHDSLDISIVTEFADELKGALDQGGAIQLQGSDIEKADTAALQLLCAFFLDAEAHGIEIEWLEPSDALCEAATQIGLSQYLGLEERTIH